MDQSVETTIARIISLANPVNEKRYRNHLYRLDVDELRKRLETLEKQKYKNKDIGGWVPKKHLNNELYNTL